MVVLSGAVVFLQWKYTAGGEDGALLDRGEGAAILLLLGSDLLGLDGAGEGEDVFEVAGELV
jgi:hypothetical protein